MYWVRKQYYCVRPTTQTQDRRQGAVLPRRRRQRHRPHQGTCMRVRIWVLGTYARFATAEHQVLKLRDRSAAMPFRRGVLIRLGSNGQLTVPFHGISLSAEKDGVVHHDPGHPREDEGILAARDGPGGQDWRCVVGSDCCRVCAHMRLAGEQRGLPSASAGRVILLPRASFCSTHPNIVCFHRDQQRATR